MAGDTAQSAAAILEGQRVTLFAEVETGAGPYTYQWYKDGAPIPAAVDPVLTFRSIQLTDEGSYAVVVSNSGGSAASPPEFLLVKGARKSRVTNVSMIASGGEMEVGFGMGGVGARGSTGILARAAGPALTQFGLSGVLPDPVLSLFEGDRLLGSNDDWEYSGALTAAGSFVGAFPFPIASKDSALYVTLPAAKYTVRVADATGAQGTVVVEIYDTANGSDRAAPRLLSVTARTSLKAEDAKLTAGFSIQGEQPVTVLIRGIGPALAGLGVTDFLENPRLTLFRGDTVVGSNENWSDGNPVEIAKVTSDVGAFVLPAGSLDSAVLVTLSPGSYTAQLSGATATGSVALLEVFEVQ
jgi:hypothetical protein